MARVLFLYCACAAMACAEVRLPALISDHMLIQRDAPVHVWGWADPGEKVTVRFQGHSGVAAADTAGRWSVYLAPVKAGTAGEIAVQGGNSITVRDVLAGDVWVASGQSNMQWSVKNADNAAAETAAANYPRLRLFKVALKTADTPQDDVKGAWTACNPDTVPDFSAVGYYFGRDLHKTLDVPIGMLQSAWGGTPADAWTSYEAIAADPALMPVFAEWAAMLERYPLANARYQIALETAGAKRPAPPPGPGHQWQPAALYNAMIAPLTPYPIRGAIWYQGESNATVSRAHVYRRLFGTMIQDWRDAWGQGDFPFLFVQLANFKAAENNRWPELREAQTQTLGLANTGMAVTIDIGNPSNIHPTNKQEVGRRLALAARAISYGEKLVYRGPIYRQATPEEGALRLWFDHTAGGLQAKGGELRGFTVTGADGKFVPAAARIDGHTVLVSSPSAPQPVSARYGWLDSPECNLYNSEGLPASPFRTVR